MSKICINRSKTAKSQHYIAEEKEMGKTNTAIERLLKLKTGGEAARFGMHFHTTSSGYWYDTGTGKVVRLDADSERILSALFDEKVTAAAFENVLESTPTLDDISRVIEQENLFAAPEVTDFIHIEDLMTEENLKCSQLVIELTGNCNLACKYCIYNEGFTGNRNFNTENIDFATAKKAIDYVSCHRDPERLSITFYGGEPLLNYPVMRQCIDYSLSTIKDVNLSFSFTTNMTLMTEEIASKDAKVPNLGILVSMDGPEAIHDLQRVYRGGKGSFHDAYRGLRILADAVKEQGNTAILFNAVLMPPYTKERFDEVNAFFESLDFLPPNINVRATYPSLGTVPTSYFEDLRKVGIDPESDNSDWMSWALEKSKKSDFTTTRQNIYSGLLTEALAKVHSRILYNDPILFHYYNGCCIPGQRRLYVCTDGKYKVCERIGTSPYIGSVDTGIDFDSVKEYYIFDYKEKSLPDCSRCWAINLCDICYAECFDEAGLNPEEKQIHCAETRNRYKYWLECYHQMLEDSPEIIKDISKIKMY